MKICVFCSSSNFVDEKYFEEARSLGEQIVQNNFELVYGGTTVGLMGAVAGVVGRGKGRITGVIPELIHSKGIAASNLDELIVTRDMRERKATMESLADAFVALPGGFGTLEELLEMITLKQLQVHQKPIVLINTDGYFDALKKFFNHIFEQSFASGRYRQLYHIADNSHEAVKYLKQYVPEAPGDKWSK